MPKAKAADFSKSKLKLGKGKQTASNAVNTSFKSRSIALPSQSIAFEKPHSEPTTRRKLAFNDLILHLKHYNPSVKKEAILGTRELFEAHPEIIEPSLTNLFGACVRLIGDEDAGVRKTLIDFFAWLLPLLPTDGLLPHTPVLLLFTTSAQTHIFPEIRIDAVKLLDTLLEVVPEAVIGEWGSDGKASHASRILQGYFGLLNIRGRVESNDSDDPIASSSSVVLSSASKLIVLNSLSTFLRLGFSSESQTPAWYLLQSFVTPEAYQSFIRVLQPSKTRHSQNLTKYWSSRPDSFNKLAQDEFVEPYHLTEMTTPLSFADLAEVVKNMNVFSNGTSTGIACHAAQVAKALHPVLVSTFLDNAPLFSLSPSTSAGNELQLISVISQITRVLYGCILQDTALSQSTRAQACEELRTLLSHMNPYFPFVPDYLAKRDVKKEVVIEEFNLVYCELTSLLVLAVQSSTAPTRGKQPQKIKGEAALALQVERVGSYVISTLRGEVTFVGQSLSASAYTSLLPTIWSLVNQGPAHQSNDEPLASQILRATLRHASKLSSNSAVKTPSLEFVARLFLLQFEPQYRGHFRITHRDSFLKAFSKDFSDWLLSLPRTLWEVGSSNHFLIEIILLTLLRAVQRQPSFLDISVYSQLQQHLIPYFNINHPARGQIPGPFTKLDNPSLRRLVLDLVTLLPSVAAGAGNRTGELEAAVGKAVSGTVEEAYWHAVSMGKHSNTRV